MLDDCFGLSPTVPSSSRWSFVTPTSAARWPPRRIPGDGDPVRAIAVGRCIRAQVADGRLDVVDLRRKARLRGLPEVHARHREAVRQEDRRHTGLGPGRPCSPVDPHQQRRRLDASGQIQIERQGFPVDAGVDEILVLLQCLRAGDRLTDGPSTHNRRDEHEPSAGHAAPSGHCLSLQTRQPASGSPEQGDPPTRWQEVAATQK